MQALKQAASLTQQTYEALLEAICSGALKPGERLSQDELAARLNVSRQPVNSAIAMLKTQRFVEDTGRRGVVVAPVDRGLFEAIYQFRAAVEPLAVELATRRLNRCDTDEGRAIIARGRKAAGRDIRAALLADMDFHSLIYRISGNPIIADTMHLNWRHLQRSMGEVLRMPGMSGKVWKQHEQIFAAMIRGDAERATSIMGVHIRDATKLIPETD